MPPLQGEHPLDTMHRTMPGNYGNNILRLAQVQAVKRKNPYVPRETGFEKPRTFNQDLAIMKNTKENLAKITAARQSSLANPPKLGKLGGKTRRRKGKKSRKTQKRR